jgi:hypothetical protein
MFTQTLIHDLALHPHQFGLDVPKPQSLERGYRRSARSPRSRAARLRRSVLLAAIVALAALPSLAHAAVEWGGGAAAAPSTSLTLKDSTNHRNHTTRRDHATNPAPNYQALKYRI